MSLRVAITITSHNRKDDLARTLSHLAQLDPRPDELLVCADGCRDGTVELLRKEHPDVCLIVHETPHGSIPSRNELAGLCESDVFISLDDDSYPLAIDFIARIREIFSNESRLAVLSFAQRTDEFPASLTSTDFGAPLFIGSYANSGAAIRRRTFEELGGYPDFFHHAYEEPDFALRCACSGWQVRYEPSLIVRHHFSNAQRNEVRTHQRHARNECWSVFMRCPLPQLIGVLLFRMARQFSYACTRGLGWVLREPWWWWTMLRGARTAFSHRNPCPWRPYAAWMHLVRHPVRSEKEWNALFDPEAP